MLVLITFLVVGSLLVYLSKFNFVPVSLNLGFAVYEGIPLFYVIVGSMLIGLVLSYVIYIFGSISKSLTIHGKNKEIKVYKDEVLELTKRVHQLELENEKQKNSPDSEPEDSNSL